MKKDVAQYKRQVSAIRKKIRKKLKGLKAGEFLYGFPKDGNLYPVVTFVIYAGEKPWDGPMSLSEMLDFKDIPNSIRSLIQDYKIHIIDVRRMKDTSVFKTDVRAVFDFIRFSKDKKMLSEMANNELYRSMELDAVELIDLYTNIRDEIAAEKYIREDGKTDMCQGLREWGEDCRTEGRAEEAKNIVLNMIKKGLNLDEICEFTNYSRQYVEDIKAEITMV